MKPAKIVRCARLDGVNLALSDNGNIAATGNDAALRKWSTTIKASKPEILAYLLDEEAQIRRWLEGIGEDDPETIDYVLTRCRERPDALVYFLNRVSGRVD